jgi:hypothetical protein
MVQGLSLALLLLEEEAPVLDEVLQVCERLNPPKNPLSHYARIRDLDPVPVLQSDPPSHLVLCALP